MTTQTEMPSKNGTQVLSKSILVKENGKPLLPEEKGEDYYSKYSHFPVESEKLEEYYQTQKNVFWTPQEIDFAEDRADWVKLDPPAKRFIKFILCFFAQADGIVNENLFDNFMRETSKLKEAGKFYKMQAAIEQIHNETYSLLIEAFFRDHNEKRKAFNAIRYYPSIKKIADWIFKWMDPKRPLAERVIAFACVEGIFFSSAFAGIYWIKKRNILKGLCKANEWIARDEAIHTEFAIALYHTLTGIRNICTTLEKEKVHEIIKSATVASEEFTRNALRVDMIGMNADDMIKYIQCTSDKLSDSLGYGKIYSAENPFDWMAVISLPNKSNFFETKVSEYGRQENNDFEFDLDAEF